MNRAERRRLGIKKPDPVRQMKDSDIEAIRQKSYKEGCQEALFLLLSIPVMVIHDKYGKLMKKEGREERFANEIINLYQLYQQGYVDTKDLEQCLWEEAGMRIDRSKNDEH